MQGTGNESRDFIHVSDVAHAIFLVALKARASGEAYNLASGIETTIHDLQQILVRELGLAVPVVFDGIEAHGNPLNWRADISRIIRLGFKPTIGIDDGATRYARWCRQEALRNG